MKNITIAGAGAFGFSMAKHLSDKLQNKDDFHRDESHEGTNIKLYDTDEQLMEHIKETRSQKYFFPETRLNDCVKPCSGLEKAVEDADVVVLAIPTPFIRGFMHSATPHLKNDVIILNLAKGLEQGTDMFISDIIEEELSKVSKKHIFATFSGGMIAKEFIQDNGIFGAEIACENEEIGRYLQKLFSSKKLRIYLNDDVIGVESAGALKNVISIASGMIDGLGCPYGSKTMIVAIAASEIEGIALMLGAKEHTFASHTQAFGNDYILSTTGDTRNRYLGELIGKGLSPERAMEQMMKERKTAEGYYTARVAFDIARRLKLKTPIIDMVYDVLYKDKNPQTAIDEIMASELEYTQNCGHSKS